MSLIVGLSGSDAELKPLAKQLKNRCGVGGSVKHGMIEMQTDDRAKLKTLLEADGHCVKLAGG